MRQYTTKWFLLMLYYQYTGDEEMAEDALLMATTYNGYALDCF